MTGKNHLSLSTVKISAILSRSYFPRFIFFQQLPVNDFLSPKRKEFPWPIIEKQQPFCLNSNLREKFLKFHPRQRLDEDVYKLFPCTDEVNLDQPPICTLPDVMEPDLYVLAPVVQNWVFYQGDRSFVVHIKHWWISFSSDQLLH